MREQGDVKARAEPDEVRLETERVRDAKTEDTSGRGEALQEDRNRKIVRASAFKRHILTSKTTKSKRQHARHASGRRRGRAEAARMLPYKIGGRQLRAAGSQ